MKKPTNPTGPFELLNLSAYRHLPRAEFVYRALKDAFAGGRFQSGDRIREDEIAQALGVSRTPVREALNRLSARGLLEVANGRSLIVAQLDRQQITEIYALREVLEATAAGLAAQQASRMEIEHLRDLLKQFTASEGDFDKLRQINRLFHQTIYEASHNRYLIQWMNEFQDTMAILRSTASAYAVNDRFRSAHEEHTLIVDAIEAHDVETAERTARLHVRNGHAQRLRILFEAQMS